MLTTARKIAVASCVLIALTACNKPQTFVTSSPPATTTPAPTVSHSPGPINAPSVGPMIYTVSDYPQTQTSILAFNPGATAAWPIQGSFPSVDADGNLYAFQFGVGVVEYSNGGLSGKLVRTIALGPWTGIAGIVDVMASQSGEIYISDGVGIAVFNSKASGNATSDRYIKGVMKATDGSDTTIVPGLIALDGSNNLYVQDTASNSVVVFKPADTGTATPAIIIAGPATLLDKTSFWGLTADQAGRVYVSGLWKDAAAGGNKFGVLVFDQAASGNVAPSRMITTSSTVDMYPYFGNLGVAVDSSGNVYLSACFAHGGEPAVFVFPPSANGPTVPSNILTVRNWQDAPESRIAVH